MKRSRLWAWALFGSTSLLNFAGLTLAIVNRNAEPPFELSSQSPLASQALFLGMYGFSVVGVLIAMRQPRNAVGWISLGVGLSWALFSVMENYLIYGLITEPGSLPAVDHVAALWASIWVAPVLLMGTYLVVLFPDGKLPSPRWRWLPWVAAIGGVVTFVSSVLLPGSLEDAGLPDVQNPFGLENMKPVLQVLQGTFLSIPICVLAAGIALVLRFRRSSGLVRMQLKWFSAAGAIVAAAYVGLFPIGALTLNQEPPLWSVIYEQFTFFSFCLMPIATGMAILKYRLYDIDVVINKTIVFGSLAAFITAVYIAIVVGIGTLLGSSDEPNLALSITATAVVAIAFSPVKERTQRVANRLVFGHRLSPYEVLTDLSRAVATAPSPNDVLISVAHAATVGVNAGSASVLLRMHDGTEVQKMFPPDGSEQGAGEVFEVSHESETLGHISVDKGAGDPLTPHDKRLLEDLSGQAGLALYNARLAIELKARLDEISAQADELQESRARIVSAADDARRRLERDITEGPRKDLVTLRHELENVLTTVETDPETAARELESLTDDANRTLDALRELARGIYPPLLADKGIVAALASHIRKRELEVEVRADDEVRMARFDEPVETTAYFCCVEALDRKGIAAIHMSLSRGTLCVEIHGGERDAEPETIVIDRIEAQAGTVEHRLDSLVFRLPAALRGEPQPEVVAQASSSSLGPN